MNWGFLCPIKNHKAFIFARIVFALVTANTLYLKASYQCCAKVVRGRGIEKVTFSKTTTQRSGYE